MKNLGIIFLKIARIQYMKENDQKSELISFDYYINCYNQEVKGGELIQNTLKPVLYVPAIDNDILKFYFNMKI